MEEEIDVVQEVQKENSFWGLCRLVFSIPFNMENILIPAIVLIILFLFNSFGLDCKEIKFTDIASFSNNLIGWYYTILAFLVAGYTIFATVTSAEMSVSLASTESPINGMSMLRYIHASFFKTIIIFLIGSTFSLLLVLLLRDWGFSGFLIKNFGNIYLWSALDAINVSAFILSLMMLKSFMYNIYSAVMIVVGLKSISIDTEKKKKKLARRRPRY
ncbi:hypothetical protein [Chromobacterium phragmitis]|uniref:hypothetical protein n=1 Tax=Chromobacterium phragmitis TaxID=2202141 RepID=UPI0011AEA65D|nr:hypothetical protein [Chromobacterium phragmitis]